MPDMLAAGVCRYGHTIRGAGDVLIRRPNGSGNACAHCHDIADDELSFILTHPPRPLPLCVPDEREWVGDTIARAYKIWRPVGC